MDQKIFKLGLSTEAVSAYLLCCGLADEGNALSETNLLEIWTGAPALLKQSLRDLEKRRILKPVDSGHETAAVYRLADVHEWFDG